MQVIKCTAYSQNEPTEYFITIRRIAAQSTRSLTVFSILLVDYRETTDRRLGDRGRVRVMTEPMV